MPDNSLIMYMGPSDPHDGRINKVTPRGDTVTVEVAGESGRSISLVFRGVIDVQAVEPVGMMLYARTQRSSHGSAASPLCLHQRG